MDSNVTTVVQKFVDWAKLKLDIHLRNNPRGVYFKERQIWWASLGQNIGSEENGKHRSFERPIIVLKKFNAEMLLAVPTSSQVKIGRYRYVFERGGRQYTANLSQIRVISAKRLLRQLGKLAETDYQRIKQEFRNVGL